MGIKNSPAQFLFPTHILATSTTYLIFSHEVDFRTKMPWPQFWRGNTYPFHEVSFHTSSFCNKAIYSSFCWKMVYTYNTATAAADDDNSIYGENGKFVVVLTFNFGKFSSMCVCIWWCLRFCSIRANLTKGWR